MIGGVNGVEIRKLDETGSSDQSIKCGGCSSCGNPSCYSSPPPPPPVLPPPPPKKQSPATPYCPPPPSSPSSAGFIYMTAPPGELYPVDHNYSGSSKTMEDAIKTFLLGFGLLASLLMI
ncbi:Espin [Bienertia sinuspersici]